VTLKPTLSRCVNCGAPLPTDHGGDYRIGCPYCEHENVLVAQVQGDAQVQADHFDRIAEETRALEQDLAPQIADLEAKLQQALEDGRHEKAVQYQEGVLRLHMAPTIRQVQAIAAVLDDATAKRQIEAAVAQCDAAVDDAASALARKLGVTYVPSAERLAAQTD
jgi:uncharacterized Zn finger protein (UPF0148 family)